MCSTHKDLHDIRNHEKPSLRPLENKRLIHSRHRNTVYIMLTTKYTQYVRRADGYCFQRFQIKAIVTVNWP